VGFLLGTLHPQFAPRGADRLNDVPHAGSSPCRFRKRELKTPREKPLGRGPPLKLGKPERWDLASGFLKQRQSANGRPEKQDPRSQTDPRRRFFMQSVESHVLENPRSPR
jgi:hypothetical protein